MCEKLNPEMSLSLVAVTQSLSNVRCRCGSSYDIKNPPKLICQTGHNCCLKCLEKIFSSAKYYNSSNGVLLQCPVCSKPLAFREVEQFPTNDDLLATLLGVRLQVARQNCVLAKCKECGNYGDEHLFHVCAECAFAEQGINPLAKGFDERSVNSNAICGCCSLKNHSNGILNSHTLLKFVELRIRCQRIGIEKLIDSMDREVLPANDLWNNLKNSCQENLTILGEIAALTSNVDSSLDLADTKTFIAEKNKAIRAKMSSIADNIKKYSADMVSLNGELRDMKEEVRQKCVKREALPWKERLQKSAKREIPWMMYFAAMHFLFLVQNVLQFAVGYAKEFSHQAVDTFSAHIQGPTVNRGLDYIKSYPLQVAIVVVSLLLGVLIQMARNLIFQRILQDYSDN